MVPLAWVRNETCELFSNNIIINIIAASVITCLVAMSQTW
jgi:hypothetical protein